MLYHLAGGNPICGQVHSNKKRDSSYAVPLFMFRTSLSGVIAYTTWTFSACQPLGPLVTLN
jgi:hypothetical protein